MTRRNHTRIPLVNRITRASVLIDKFGSFWPDRVEVRMAKGKASKIELSGEERSELESLARRRSTGQALALRSRIVLAAAEGVHNGLIAERLGIFRGTVGKWRERFALERLAGLYDEPRPGAPRQSARRSAHPPRAAAAGLPGAGWARPRHRPGKPRDAGWTAPDGIDVPDWP